MHRVTSIVCFTWINNLCSNFSFVTTKSLQYLQKRKLLEDPIDCTVSSTTRVTSAVTSVNAFDSFICSGWQLWKLWPTVDSFQLLTTALIALTSCWQVLAAVGSRRRSLMKLDHSTACVGLVTRAVTFVREEVTKQGNDWTSVRWIEHTTIGNME